MEAQRPAKRRRVEALESRSKENLPGSKKDKATSNHEIPAKEDDHAQEQPALTNGTKSSYDAWQEAKARARAMRGKKHTYLEEAQKDVDVYDDIDGANAHQSPLKKPGSASTPKKKQLDPLRNQKQTSASSPSPAKSRATVGFFKQFQKPRTESATSTTKKDGGTGRFVNGTGARDDRGHVHDAALSADVGDSSSESESDEGTPETPVRSAGGASWKGWVNDAKPKKTFEDEIKELEVAARHEAESNDAAATSSAMRPKRATASGGKEQAPAKVKTKVRKDARAKDSEKRNSANRAASPIPLALDDDDQMDIDHSEHDYLPNVQQKLMDVAAKSVKSSKAKIEPLKKVEVPPDERAFMPKHLRVLQTIILDRLTGKRAIKLANLDEEHAKVSQLVSQTITAGESNSMLLIGARGSGKTALVNHILGQQSAKHPDDFHVVRLNGFIHTDDKIALRDIWRQLGREMELDDEESTSKNYADTLSTLLALLSHPAEQGREEADQVTKSVIFILDEFELFASHPRQTLLYNLFDIAQSRKAPIAVLGLTTRIDVAESLEKRVKSRFSHRYVHLSSAKSFNTFQEACKAAVTIHSDDLSIEEREQFNVPADGISAKLQAASHKEEHKPVIAWNAFIDRLLGHDSLATHLKRLYYTTKSVPDFHTSLLLAISPMPTDEPTTPTTLITHITSTLPTSTLRAPDSKLTILSCLSTLHLALLICAARLNAIHNTDVVPFIQAYEEYKVLASKAKLQATASGALAQGAGSRVWGKEVARGGWEDLVGFGLLMVEGGRGCRVDVALEEIGLAGVELGGWGRWCREI